MQAPRDIPKSSSARSAEDRRTGTVARVFPRVPFHKVNWPTSSFLIGTLLMSLTLVPVYIWRFGLDWFQVALFLGMFFLTGFSITLGYHRLFSHLAFQAHWSVRLFTLIFGAAAFENSVLLWACEHRAHHKHVDHEDDPYTFEKDFSKHTSDGCFSSSARLRPLTTLPTCKRTGWSCGSTATFIGLAQPSLSRCPPQSVTRGAAGRRRLAHFSSPAWPVCYSFNTAPSVSTRFATISANRHIRASAVRATRG